MSHRVTTATEIRDRNLLAQAAKLAKIEYREDGDLIHFQTGPLAFATLDLRTGIISGDVDYGHTQSSLGALRQAYGEVKYKTECMRQGIQIESRQVDERTGDVVLLCALG
jgi:hypothetical protein